MSRPESITMARWWGDKLRDTSWLEAEDERYRVCCRYQRMKAKLTEERIHRFEVHLAIAIDQLLRGMGTTPSTVVGNREPEYPDHVVTEAARKAGIPACGFMFPPRCYTFIEEGEITAGSTHEGKRILQLASSW